MAVKFKLKRIGSKKKPVYRIILIDESRAPSSREVEAVGEYNPRITPTHFIFNKERVMYWMGQGAQPTDKLRILFGKAGVMPAVDLSKLTKKKSKAKGEEGAAAAPAPAAAAPAEKKEA